MESTTENFQLKCKMCRALLAMSTTKKFLNGHGQPYKIHGTIDENCTTIQENSKMFIDDSHLDDPSFWIVNAIEEQHWTKGKLKCPNCSTKIGSFDFIGDDRCQCGMFTQRKVHLTRGKVDVENC